MFKLFLVALNILLVSAQYEVPDAIVEVYHPKGFSVSIPDEEGITLFAFHGKINEEMNGVEAGTFSKDILKPKNGLWTFKDTTTRLRLGDVIYFWTFVEYNDGTTKSGYVREDQSYTVTEIIKKPNGNSGNQKFTTPSTTTTTTIKTTTTTTEEPEICEDTETVINGGSYACKGQLIFNEEFNSKNLKLWNVVTKFAGKPDYEFVLYDKKNTLSVQNNILKIKPILAEQIYGPDFVNTPLDLGERCTGIKGTSDCRIVPDAGFIAPPVLSSKITTKNTFSFKYGKVEVTAKLPKGDWIYPIIRLRPVVEEYGPGYESGQITVAFAAGNGDIRNTVNGGVILGESPKARKYGMKTISQNKGWSDNFYKFGVTWRPDSIALSVNDKVYGSVFPPDDGFSSLASTLKLKYADRLQSGTILAPFDQEMYISIGVGVGGFNFEDRTDGRKPWRNGERLSTKKFNDAREQWYSTWSNNSMLQVKSVKVWAL